MSTLLSFVASVCTVIGAGMAMVVVIQRQRGKNVKKLKRRGIKLSIFVLICLTLSIAFEPSDTKSAADEAASVASSEIQAVSSRNESDPVMSSPESEVESVSVGESEPEAVVLSPKELYNNGEVYLNQQVEVTGEIIRISDYSDMKGYYLYGTTGEGLVFWIYEKDKSANIGDTVTFRGTVQNLGDKQVEVTNCRIVK